MEYFAAPILFGMFVYMILTTARLDKRMDEINSRLYSIDYEISKFRRVVEFKAKSWEQDNDDARH